MGGRIIILGMVLMGIFVDGIQAQPAPVSAPSASLTFTCTDKSGAPVAGAEVYLADYHNALDPAKIEVLRKLGPAMTDPQGRVTFPEVAPPPRPFTRLLFARVPGHLIGGLVCRVPPFPGSPEPSSIPMEPSVTYRGKIEAPTGYDMTAVHCRLEFLIFSDSVEGVYYQFQHILHGLQEPDPWVISESPTPDAGGWVHFSNLPADLPINGLITNAPGLAQDRCEASPDHQFFVQLHPGRTVTGHVTDEAGHPLSGISVSASEPQPKREIQGGTLQWVIWATTDEKGDFSLPGLTLKKTYIIQAKALKDHVSNAVVIDVSPDKEVPPLALTVEPGIPVTGKVAIGAGMVSAFTGTDDTAMNQYDQTWNHYPAASSQAGTFNLLLPSGTNTIVLSSPMQDISTFQQELVRKTVQLKQGQPAEEIVFDTSPSDPGQPIDFHGRVVDQNGAGLANIPVQVFSKPIPALQRDGAHLRIPAEHPTARTAADGTYTVSLEPGDYVEVAAEGKDTTRDSSDLFYVWKGATTALKDLKLLPATASISGRVVDADGKPVPELLMHVQPQGKPGFDFGTYKPTVMSPTTPAVKGGRTNDTGVFNFSKLPPDRQVLLHFNSNFYVTKTNLNRDVWVQSGATDLVIEAVPPHLVRPIDPLTLLGQAAPDWSVDCWLDPTGKQLASSAPPPSPKRSDGHWTVLFLQTGFDPEIDWKKMGAAVRALAAEPVVIWNSSVDRSIPAHVLVHDSPEVLMGCDRYEGNLAAAYGFDRSNLVLIDPQGIIRACDDFSRWEYALRKYQALMAEK